eukprot:5937624-Amphidinium_carterae.1
MESALLEQSLVAIEGAMQLVTKNRWFQLEVFSSFAKHATQQLVLDALSMFELVPKDRCHHTGTTC